MRKLCIWILCLPFCLMLVAGCAPKEGILHYATWDMTKEELIAAEGEENIVEGASDRVLNWMNTDQLTVFGERTVSVGYVFTEDKLSGITVQIFLKDGETLADGMKATRAAMDKVYGESTGEDNDAHWHHEMGTIVLQTVEGTENFFVANFSPETHSH